MNVKKIKILASAIVMIQCASCQQIEEKTYEIRAEAVDGSNKPIANVMVLSGKLELVKDSPIPTANPVLLEPVPTDASGIALLRFRSVPTPGGNVNFCKEGYYSSYHNVTWTSPEGFRGTEQKAKVIAILKPVNNPIPMIARKDLRIRTPEFEVAYGFDLKMGDSLPPLGNGKHADIEFILSGTRQDIGIENKEHIDFKVEIRCPNPDDGFVMFEIEDSLEFRKGSVLQSDHEAPAEGYVNRFIRQYANDQDGGMTAAYGVKNDIKNKCVYFRIRTERSENGEIASAHYGKMYGPIEIRPAFKRYGHDISKGHGGLFIQYLYFNPTPNDRNVEFDPKRNLNSDSNVLQP